MREHRLAPSMRSPHRLQLMALALLIGVLLAPLATSPASAQDDDGFAITADVFLPPAGDTPKQPQPGITVILTDADGAEVDQVPTGDDGLAVFSVDEQGEYVLSFDESTLPEGLAPPEVYPVDVPLRGNQARRPMQLRALDDSGEIITVDRSESFGDKLARVPQLFVDGIKFGSIIAITAIGLSLIFGTTGLVNFAHGELVTLGAVTAYAFNASGAGPGMSLYFAAVIAVGVGAFSGQAIEAGIWAPLRKRGVGLISMLVISIGLSFIIRNIIQILVGGGTLRFRGLPAQSAVPVLGVNVIPRDLVIIALAITVLVGVGLMLQYTRIGKALRAVADNKDLAESSGIDVQKVIRFVWMLGGGLTAFGGVLLGVAENGFNFNAGFNLLMLMFAGMILGGIGTAYGAMVGSLVVGIVSQVSTAFFSTQLKFVWALVILIVVLLIKPQGILGKAERFG